MRHIDEIQIAGTAILLCGAMFAVSAVAPTGNTVSKAVTNFTEAPETAAEAQAQAEAQAEEDGFTIYTQESNYDSDYDNSYNDTSYNDSSYNTATPQDGSLDDTGQENDNTDTAAVYYFYLAESEKSVLQKKNAAVLLYYQMRIIGNAYIRNKL